MLRTSPIYDRLQLLQGSWRSLNHMLTLTQCPTDAINAPRLGIADVTYLTRWGIKGANAAQWLSQQGITVPDRPNSWRELPDGGIMARLGLTEFLIEDSAISSVAPQLATACQAPPDKVYPVLRQDLALILVGDRVPDLLRQTCNVNFNAWTLSDRPVILTTMMGIAVTLIPNQHHQSPYYHLWCDGTYGIYVWQTLVDIATELEGGAIGIARLEKSVEF